MMGRSYALKKLPMGQSKKELSFQFLFSRAFIRGLAQKPISLLATLVALGLLLLVIIKIGRGNIYYDRLDYIDVTTLAMVALLLLRAVTKLYSASDLETISIALVSSLSFLYSYEAIYKWSFYLLPWKMPPAELRAFLLQVGVGLILLTGFAQGVFKLRRSNLMILAVFMATWLFWLAAGFPQLWDGKLVHDAVIDFPMTRNMIYGLNRATKLIWFMFYYCLYV